MIRNGVSDVAYTYGNTIRKETLPKTDEHALQKQQKETSLQVRKNRNKALHMSAGYVVFLAIAAVAALVVCTGYLRLQSEITSRSRNIASLQEELADLKEDNTTRYNAVLNSVNLEEIREKAINELGMVYANPEQIIKYKSPTSSKVKQYEDIPENGVLAESDKIDE